MLRATHRGDASALREGPSSLPASERGAADLEGKLGSRAEETMSDAKWHDLGPTETLKDPPLRQLAAGRTKIALSWKDGAFGAISGVCNHVGGPLGEGRLDGDYVVCPWHQYKFHCRTGEGEPGFEKDAVPRFTLKEEGGHLWVDLASATPRSKLHHPPHPLERKLEREPGPIRVAGVSTTVMDPKNPRYSTSEALLECALEHARAGLAAETRLIRLSDLSFRNCEGYYSKSAHACTWPCSITQMDPADQMEKVYEAFVFWADVVVIATPIRWGSASSLYFKMAERLNCVQNQVTLREPRDAAEQGRDVHRHGRAGQRAGRRGAAPRLLRRARHALPAVPLHRAQPRMDRGGHGEERRDGEAERVVARGSAGARAPRDRAREAPDRDRSGGDPARRPQGVPRGHAADLVVDGRPYKRSGRSLLRA
jgi:nitrite reductase/ring-hydroxylating ferredoxin subunit